MGYDTYYNLTWEPTDEATNELVAAMIGANEDASYTLAEDGSGENSSRSYDEMLAFMQELTDALPEVAFTLCGDGEESEDLWQMYALGGETQQVGAYIMYPTPKFAGWPVPTDPKLLQWYVFAQMIDEVHAEMLRTFEQLGDKATGWDYLADAGRWLSNIAQPEMGENVNGDGPTYRTDIDNDLDDYGNDDQCVHVGDPCLICGRVL